MSQPMSKAAKKAGRSELWETIIVIIEALLIALVFRTVLYQPYSIPTGSMQSTMLIGDYFLANKYVWGLGKYSFPLPVPFNGRIMGREPNRGDIAVFHNISGEDFIKRVIGLPGDTIQVTGGILNINGTPVKRELIGEGMDVGVSGFGNPVKLYKETLPNGVEHTIQEISDNAEMDNTSPYQVPPGHFFMMGDNRDNSRDSRYLGEVGYVPYGSLIGKAEATFFSINNNIPPWQLWQWPANVRWDRMFKSVYQ